MVKKLIKNISLLLFLVAIILVAIDQTRSFYCLSNNKCVTVWKRLGNKCYVIPGKYYGILKPTDDYVKTANTNSITIIWLDNNSWLIDADKNVEIFNDSTHSTLIQLYNNEKSYNDSLYTYFDGKYQKYKKNVNYMSIDIKENYVLDKSPSNKIELFQKDKDRY